MRYSDRWEAESKACAWKPTMSDAYTCPACNRTFDKVDTDDDVDAEAQLVCGDAGLPINCWVSDSNGTILAVKDARGVSSTAVVIK